MRDNVSQKKLYVLPPKKTVTVVRWDTWEAAPLAMFLPTDDTRNTDHEFTLGPYVLTARIATGGMATVYRAEVRTADSTHEYAIKVFHPHLSGIKGLEGRFLDEARIASHVNHANVVSTIDAGTSRGYHYLVLGLIDGVTLRQIQLYRDRHDRFTANESARIVADAARGLQAVHSVDDERGAALHVVHRDLSPHNLMLNTRGRAVLIDLGLSKADGQICHTETGVLCGKLPYMSPEQSRLSPLDARSDVFSLGTVLFELCTGELPFGDAHTARTLERLRTCDREILADRLTQREIPVWLSNIVLRCLHADPNMRYGSALALAESLEQGLSSNGADETAQRELRLGLSRCALKTKSAADAEYCSGPLVLPRLGVDAPRSPPLSPTYDAPRSPGDAHSTPPMSAPAAPSTRRPASDRHEAAELLASSDRQKPTVVVRRRSHSPIRSPIRPAHLHAVRWVALGAALVLVAFTGRVFLKQEEATSKANTGITANLAVETANRTQSPSESRIRTPEPEPPHGLDGSTGDTAADDAAWAAEQARASKRRRRRLLRSRSRASRKLRQNPYRN